MQWITNIVTLLIPSAQCLQEAVVVGSAACRRVTVPALLLVVVLVFVGMLFFAQRQPGEEMHPIIKFEDRLSQVSKQ